MSGRLELGYYDGRSIVPVTTTTPLPVAPVAGSAIIGKVGIDQTTPGTTNGVQVNAALPAGSNAIGNVGVAPRAAQLTPAAVSFSSSGDNTVVAGVSAQTVKVYQLWLVAAAATVITFKSGAGTSLSGAATLNAGGSIVLDFSSEPWFTTAAAAAFVINSTNAVQISGTVYSLTS